jgi:hypothetical protein
LVGKYQSKTSRRSKTRQSFKDTTSSPFDNDSNQDMDFGSIKRETEGSVRQSRRKSSRKKSSSASNRGNSSQQAFMQNMNQSTSSLLTGGGSQLSSKDNMSQSTSSLWTGGLDDLNEDTLDFYKDSAITTPDRGTPDKMMGNSARIAASTRASVSPSFYLNMSDHHVQEDHSTPYARSPAPSSKQEEEHTSLLLSSDMADPNDPLVGGGMPMEHFQDEFDQEMDEIEMRSECNKNFIRLSELEAKANSKTRRRYGATCCRCVFAAAVIGAIVGLVVYLSTARQPTVVKTAQEVPKVEARMVGLWCNEQWDLGPGQSATFPLVPTDDCKNACNKAECCWHPTGNYECTPETRDNCLAYTDCSIMIPHSTSDEIEEQAVVPQAPATLKTTCVPIGPTFTATSACYDLCSAVDCCWNTTSTTTCTATSEQQANCQPYQEFCSFFNEYPPTGNGNSNSDWDFPAAPSDLDDYCDLASRFSPDQCQHHCAAAACCWKVGTVNCAANVPNNMCVPYAEACGVLNTLNLGNGDSGNNNDGEGTTSTESTGIPSTSPDASSVTIPQAPDGLETYCDPAEMEEISLQMCQDKCSPAECCWSTETEALCPSSVPAETCQPYVQACAILNDLMTYPGGDSNANDGDGSDSNQPAVENAEIPQAPSDLATRCSKDNITGSSNGASVLIQCERECLEASCCWRPGATTCTSNQLCQDYQGPCSIFLGLFSGDGGNDGTTVDDGDNNGSDQSGTGSDEAKEIQDACNSQVAFFVKTRCEKACRPGACCYDDGMACSAGVDCALYEPCIVLHRNRHNLRH